MLLISSLVFVLGTVAVIVSNAGSTGLGVRFGYEQLIHARIPWLLIGSLALGCTLGVASIVRGYDQSDTYRERARLDDVFRAIDQLGAGS